MDLGGGLQDRHGRLQVHKVQRHPDRRRHRRRPRDHPRRHLHRRRHDHLYRHGVVRRQVLDRCKGRDRRRHRRRPHLRRARMDLGGGPQDRHGHLQVLKGRLHPDHQCRGQRRNLRSLLRQDGPEPLYRDGNAERRDLDRREVRDLPGHRPHLRHARLELVGGQQRRDDHLQMPEGRRHPDHRRRDRGARDHRRHLHPGRKRRLHGDGNVPRRDLHR